MTKLSKCLNIGDLRRRAKARLPRAMFGYIDGFAEDGATGQRNRAAFDRYQLVPRMLSGTSAVDLSTEIFGRSHPYPVILAPTALSRLFHTEGERAVAGAAAARGLTYSLSTLSSFPIEEIGQIGGPRWFQMYVYKDQDLATDMLDRAVASGYEALVITVDANIGGNREHDIRNGFVIPPRPSLATIVEAARHPSWCWDLVTKPRVSVANVGTSKAPDGTSLLSYLYSQLDQALNWDTASRLADYWRRIGGGPVLIKGLLSASDAWIAAERGFDGIVVSNHGGRQLDHAPASLDVLPEIVAATGERLTIIVDSGFRRGTDILKALILGADACMIGRPYLFGLAAGGREGVDRALEIVLDELVLDCRLMGCANRTHLTAACLRDLHGTAATASAA